MISTIKKYDTYQIIYLFISIYHEYSWAGSSVVRMLASRARGRGFDSHPAHSLYLNKFTS